jgi:hypothetical protein
MKNTAKYIEKSDKIRNLLQTLRNNKCKLFLLTNSDWQYANLLMSFTLGSNWTGNICCTHSLSLCVLLYEQIAVCYFTECGYIFKEFFDLILLSTRKPYFWALDRPFYGSFFSISSYSLTRFQTEQNFHVFDDIK